MEKQQILDALPYSEPFLFVDELIEVDENGVKGSYTFKKDAFFYKGHFKNNPITPGVILTECMAQIGVVCLGIFLLKDENKEVPIALSTTNIDFFLPVLPGETVQVSSSLDFFRFKKMQCQVAMHNSEGKLICRGKISGMIDI